MAECHEQPGDLSAALLQNAEGSLVIAERLAALDGTNAVWRRMNPHVGTSASQL